MFTAVVLRSVYAEDPSGTMASVRQHGQGVFTRDVVVVDHSNANAASDAITIADLDEYHPSSAEVKSVVEVPPHLTLSKGTIRRIKLAADSFKVSGGNWVAGIRTRLALDNVYWSAFFLYGFILVSTIWDRFHGAWERNKIYQTNDVVIRYLLNGTVAPFETSRLRKIRSRPAEDDDDTAIVCPPVCDTTYLLSYLRLHRHYGLGLWILVYLVYHWGMVVLFFSKAPVAILGCIWLLQTFIVRLLASPRLDMPHMWFFCLLYPVYHVLFPVMVLYARTYTPKGHWTSKKSSL
jgi:hypothetical protein